MFGLNEVFIQKLIVTDYYKYFIQGRTWQNTTTNSTQELRNTQFYVLRRLKVIITFVLSSFAETKEDVL